MCTIDSFPRYSRRMAGFPCVVDCGVPQKEDTRCTKVQEHGSLKCWGPHGSLHARKSVRTQHGFQARCTPQGSCILDPQSSITFHVSRPPMKPSSNSDCLCSSLNLNPSLVNLIFVSRKKILPDTQEAGCQVQGLL